MSFADLVRFALRALVGHRVRTGMSLLGMAIGVAAVIVLTALGEGARRYVSSQFANIGTNLLIVVPGKTETSGIMPGVAGVPNDLTIDDYQALLRGIREVRRGAPVTTSTGRVSHAERSRQVAIIGANKDFLEIRHLAMARGEFLPQMNIDRGAPVAVIGQKVAAELFPGEDPIGKVLRIDAWRMRIIGVLSQRGEQLGVNVDDVVVIPTATSMRMFNRSSLFRILLEVRTHSDLDRTGKRVVEIIKERHGEEDVTCIAQDSVVTTFNSILGTLTLALVGIASVSLSVAGIGIMNVMLVSVTERTPEVGLLKALGAARSQILAAFVTEAAVLSTFGGLLGLLTGGLAVRILVGIYPDLPASPPLWAAGSALAVSVVVGIVFGVLPARRAARLDPILALARR